MFLTLTSIVNMKTAKRKREKVLISLRGENSSQVLITSPRTYKIRPLLSIFLWNCAMQSQNMQWWITTQRLFTFSLSLNTTGKSLCSIAVKQKRNIAYLWSIRQRKQTWFVVRLQLYVTESSPDSDESNTIQTVNDLGL